MAPSTTSAAPIDPPNGVRVEIQTGCPSTLDGQVDDSSTDATWTVNPDADGLADVFVPGPPTGALICRYLATDGPVGLAAPLSGGALFSSTLLSAVDAQTLADSANEIVPSAIMSGCVPPDFRPRYTALVFALDGRPDVDVWLKQWFSCPELTNGAHKSGLLINGVGHDFMAVLDQLAAPAPNPLLAGRPASTAPSS